MGLIDTTPRQTGTERRIDRALELAETGLFTTSGGARIGAKKVRLLTQIINSLLT
jgi:hypothetical protein